MFDTKTLSDHVLMELISKGDKGQNPFLVVCKTMGGSEIVEDLLSSVMA